MKNIIKDASKCLYIFLMLMGIITMIAAFYISFIGYPELFWLGLAIFIILFENLRDYIIKNYNVND